MFERNGEQRIFTALEQINALLNSEEDHDSDDNLEEDEALEEDSE